MTLSPKFSESEASYRFRTISADSAYMTFVLQRITGRLQISRNLGIFGACVYNGYQALFFAPTFNEPGYKASTYPTSSEFKETADKKLFQAGNSAAPHVEEKKSTHF